MQSCMDTKKLIRVVSNEFFEVPSDDECETE